MTENDAFRWATIGAMLTYDGKRIRRVPKTTKEVFQLARETKAKYKTLKAAREARQRLCERVNPRRN